MANLVVRDLVKTHGAFVAVNGVSFEAAEGEFITLLGPSGCGKSTTLSAIAGLDHPTTGLIRAGDRDFFNSDRGIALLPEQRNCGLVFQAYALWPHMTVRQNVEFPLKLRKVNVSERRRRVDDSLALVEMTRFSERYPHELSGGQQQRVALARTLVYDPAILLLDEPLSNLDAKLRERARVWLSQLHRAIKRTTVYVTHDQTEALALSDRIIVMNEGRIVQIGTPQEIYEHPAEPFVADFIGTSSFLKGTLRRAGAEFSDIELEDGTMMQAGTTPGIAPGTKITIAVRPERLTLTRSNHGPVGETGTLIPAAVQANSYLGARYQYELEIAGAVVRTESPERFSDQNIGVWMPASACVLFAQSAA